MYDKEKMPISAMYVPYMKSSEILDNEPYFRSFSGLKHFLYVVNFNIIW